MPTTASAFHWLTALCLLLISIKRQSPTHLVSRGDILTQLSHGLFHTQETITPYSFNTRVCDFTQNLLSHITLLSSFDLISLLKMFKKEETVGFLAAKLYDVLEYVSDPQRKSFYLELLDRHPVAALLVSSLFRFLFDCCFVVFRMKSAKRRR